MASSALQAKFCLVDFFVVVVASSHHPFKIAAAGNR